MHTLKEVKLRTFQILLRFIEFDLVVVPLKFDAFDWLELLLAGRYYGLERLSSICEELLLERITDANIHRMFELAVRHRVHIIANECAEMLVLQESLECRDKPNSEAMTPLQQKLQQIKVRTRSQLAFYIGQLLIRSERDNPEKATHE